MSNDVEVGGSVNQRASWNASLGVRRSSLYKIGLFSPIVICLNSHVWVDIIRRTKIMKISATIFQGEAFLPLHIIHKITNKC